MDERISNRINRIKRIAAAGVVVLVSALLAGCFQIDRTVHLKADGSGTVEETVMISKTLTSMFDMKEPGAEGNKPEPKKKEDELAEVEKTARAKVAGMGEGVSLVSVTLVQKGDFEGYRAVYAFKDINKLTLEADATPVDKGPGSGRTTSFHFTRGANSVLVMKNGAALPKEQVAAAAAPPVADAPAADAPAADAPAAGAPAAAAMSPAGADNPQAQQAMDMLKQMFNGMRFSDKIMIEGTVIESNALFRTGPEITLVEVDLGELLKKKPEELMKLQQAVPPDDKQKMLAAMSKIPGLKVDLNDELRVVFR
ncbi:hypothetical protein L4X63_21975 [Geomonas sp. Red32]|uniref:hypothetical protein n=1 Tax=Geomonas sp. Red32 TaxID=2912856 RepID=UPI00202CF2A2|nr:hypothetical protein [Geomonas sp. Red32]MCM0084256.1 hypothetical protein [Geomonas sp. Red32]